MLLQLTSRIAASDLGYLLHKNPARLHTFELPFGQAHVFYPRVSSDEGTAALLLDVDPVELARGRRGLGSDNFSLRQYVNDRPYATTSFMSVAIARVFGTAMAGRSKERQDLADRPLEMTATLTAVPCRGGADFIDALFKPLGYDVGAQHHPLDEQFPEWGDGPYHTLQIRGNVRLKDLLAHLYVLIPVLDADKHYWVGEAEVDKLLRKGEGWLASHPERDAIAHRYLARQQRLTRSALARLADEDVADPDADSASRRDQESAIEKPIKLWQQRVGAVMSVLRGLAANRVVDLGCGEGKLIQELIKERVVEEIVGMDVSFRSLERAQDRLHLDQLAPAQRSRIRLIHGSLMYRDKRLEGFDAATVIEVIEHLDPARLAAFERTVFECARPRHVIVTTPNAEYNVKFEGLPAGRFRHRDHRFEWTRAEFQSWAEGVAKRCGYTARFLPVGPEDSAVGPPTQMGVFSA